MAISFNPPDQAALEALKTLVGPKGWKPADASARHFDDPRGRFQGHGALILMPANTQEVADIVMLCNDAQIGIIPFSGGTGVVAGQLSIDSDNAIILSLERMNKVRDISLDDGVLVAEAGCILETIHATAQAHDMIFPLSMASKGSCCIGGNLATNAGGIQVLRHGNARDLCLGIEAVLPNGEIYQDLSPLRKDNTGYDLRHLLIGSEGTLGIITAATLVIKPMDAETVTAFCAIASPAAALTLYRHLQRDLGNAISALELMSGFGLELVTKHFPKLADPFADKHPWYMLMDVGGAAGTGAQVENALAEAFEKDLLSDAIIAQSQGQQVSLWDLRENTPEANKSGGAFCNSDTSVPVSKVDPFIVETRRAILAIHPGVRINSYGHIGDGNIHHNVLPPEGLSKSDFIAAHPDIIESVRMAINEATAAFDGSISAEHGIGRLKTRDLEHYSNRAKQTALRQIKAAMDPNNIMNPGAVLV